MYHKIFLAIELMKQADNLIMAAAYVLESDKSEGIIEQKLKEMSDEIETLYENLKLKKEIGIYGF